jgi:hypothetical protein
MPPLVSSSDSEDSGDDSSDVSSGITELMLEDYQLEGVCKLWNLHRVALMLQAFAGWIQVARLVQVSLPRRVAAPSFLEAEILEERWIRRQRRRSSRRAPRP